MMQSKGSSAQADPGSADGLAAPVFVLCGGRSGSTLLRFVLDAHPDLACPPETNVPTLCGQLATVWSLIEGAPLSQNRGDEPPEIPDAAIAGVRETMDRLTGSYLERRGKKRYCDKSLGTAQFAFLMTRIWPEAKFICLFRHPMDVISSGMEACPWGLNGYGFDPYIAETPGNSVFALARFWVDTAGTILAAEQEYADRCYRVRYEDLTEDPQAVADGVYKFLGVDPVPGIAEKIFAGERERFGPADYKIWYTSQISTESVGRGWTVPAGLIGPLVRQTMNELCGKLGYLAVDDNWGTADQPADFRVPITEDLEDAEEEQEPEAAETPASAAGSGAEAAAPRRPRPAVVADPEAESAAELIAPQLIARLRAGVSRADADFARRWSPCDSDVFMLAATGGGDAARWLVDIAARTVTAVNGSQPAASGGDAETDEGQAYETTWDVIATVDTWRQLLDQQVNMSVALRRHELRYLEQDETSPIVADTRIGMLADLLGLATWGQAQTRARSGVGQDVPAAKAG